MKADSAKRCPGHQRKPMIQKTDTILVEAAIDGDPESFTKLCRRYYPAMVAITHSLLGDRHLAEDPAQETFAKVAVKLPQLRKTNKFAGWLAAICRNQARDMARRENSIQANDEFSRTAAEPQKDDSGDGCQACPEKAFEQCLMTETFAYHIGDDTLISYLVSISVRNLAYTCIQEIAGRAAGDTELLQWVKKELANSKVNSLSPARPMKRYFKRPGGYTPSV